MHTIISRTTGSKSHKSQRVDHYGEPYQPGDVIGCHIALFEDSSLNNMSFYRNGVDQGVAYRGADIPAGIYFPAVSLYMKVSYMRYVVSIPIMIVMCGAVFTSQAKLIVGS